MHEDTDGQVGRIVGGPVHALAGSQLLLKLQAQPLQVRVQVAQKVQGEAIERDPHQPSDHPQQGLDHLVHGPYHAGRGLVRVLGAQHIRHLFIEGYAAHWPPAAIGAGP
jgi:hypothetical protein